MDPLTLRRSVLNGRFRLRELLAVTPQGWRFEADDLEADRRGLLWLWPADSDPCAAVAQHLGALAELAHPNVLAVRAVGEVRTGAAAGLGFMATEGADATLAENLPLPMENVRALALDIAAALEYLHEVRLAHRHLTPACVFRTDQGWKLGGVGTVDRGPRAALLHAWRSGEWRFLAPDLLAGRAGAAADVWALGCLLLTAITGQALHDGTPPDVVLALATRKPTLPRLPQPWDLIIPGCLQPDIDRRWDATDVLTVLQGGPAPAEEPRLAHGPARPRRVHVWPRQGEHRLAGHTAEVTALAWAGSRLLSGDANGAVRLWDTSTGTRLRAWDGPGGRVDAVAVRPDGRAAAGTGDGRLRVWTAKGAVTQDSAGAPVRALWWTGWEVASLVASEPLVWTATAKHHGTLDGHLTGVPVSCQGSVLALAEGPHGVAWGTGSGQVGYHHDGQTALFQAAAPILSVALSPTLLAAVTADRDVLVLSVPDLTWTHVAENLGVRCVAFSSDGDKLAMGLRDGSIRING
jgi:hypothetical protein